MIAKMCGIGKSVTVHSLITFCCHSNESQLPRFQNCNKVVARIDLNQIFIGFADHLVGLTKVFFFRLEDQNHAWLGYLYAIQFAKNSSRFNTTICHSKAAVCAKTMQLLQVS